MPAETEINLLTDIAALDGMTPERADAFRRLGLRCVSDLITHLPMRHELEHAEQSISESHDTVVASGSAGANIAVRGEVMAVQSGFGRARRVTVDLADDTGTLQLVWFNLPWMRKKLHPGMMIRAWGKGKLYKNAVQISNPRWEAVDADGEEAARDARLRPVYPGSESLNSATIERVVDSVLDAGLACIHDHLDAEYRRSRALPELAAAYRMMHRPVSERDVEEGRYRLAFDELLMMQLGVMLKRRHRRETLHAPALTYNDSIDAHILERIPFELTHGQRMVTSEIARDLSEPTPMNRLLQGDVGAGKTVVALFALLMAVASDQQGALMAPTELLAEQHYESISRMLEGSRVNVGLLTGSLKPAARGAILERLAHGDIDILVGTHALLTESVNFENLAVIVIDEQHRFGVHQRAVLRAKSTDPASTPHTLVMTATPIPRTMSLSIFGDLDVSTILGRPPGRQSIITKHVPTDEAREVYDFVNERIGHGEQAFIVVPAVEASDAGLVDVQSHLQWLRQGPLAGRRVEAVHGRLSREERDAVMIPFRQGEIDAIVATTVIEVGVDVPNATMMIIENADRFGLAQLHQLRGRVGRGDRQSMCVLIADPATDDGQARLAAVVATDDGFVIAEKDLEIRGPGELFGARQSGVAPFHVAEFPRDSDLLRTARNDAARWIRENPLLAGAKDALLRRRLMKLHGESLGLGDVA